MASVRFCVMITFFHMVFLFVGSVIDTSLGGSARS